MDSELENSSRDFLENRVRNALDNYEVREPQLKMMTACARVIENGGILMTEAGTGELLSNISSFSFQLVE